MLPTHSGSFRFFRFRGIQVFVHWSWFIVAVVELAYRRRNYESPVWNLAEYLALFLIVLLHEFGHAFACRQTGGRADEIILWPLGGVAFVQPPPRPGAELWSIAAGPLVNVILVPLLFAAAWTCGALGWTAENPDLRRFLNDIILINIVLLVFNIMPVYPLDGGQILRSVLWFFLGRGRSLFVASIVGLIGVAALAGFALWRQSFWIGLMALFMGERCLHGFRQAKALRALERMPSHPEFSCPSCKNHPPGGPLWLCPSCGNRFDPFSTRGVCPHCQAHGTGVPCVHCGAEHPLESWARTGRRSAGEPPVIDV